MEEAAMTNSEDGMFDVALNGAFVFDGEEKLAGPKSIGVRGGRIEAVSDSPLRGRDTIDASGRWIGPGLVESHVHLFDPANSTDPEGMAQYVGSELAKNLASFLSYGFTTVKSV